MYKILAVFSLLLMSACDVEDEFQAIASNIGDEKEWVFAQFNVKEESDGIESYYYYGQVSEELLKQIMENRISTGFILLEDVRYWGDKDIIYSLRDRERTGDLIFRIEDVVKIDIVHKAPIVGQGYEQYEKAVSNGNGEATSLE